jgi:hypothetical protein
MANVYFITLASGESDMSHRLVIEADNILFDCPVMDVIHVTPQLRYYIEFLREKFEQETGRHMTDVEILEEATFDDVCNNLDEGNYE